MKTDRRLIVGAVAVVHVASWLLFITLPLLISPPPRELESRLMHDMAESMLPGLVFSNLMLVGVFYLNTGWVFRRFDKRQLAIAAIAQPVMAALVYWCTVGFHWCMGHDGLYPPLPPVIASFLFILLVSVCYHLVRQNIQAERRNVANENARLLTELQFLRWQIGPHFLFNVLNSLVALARQKSDRLEPMLMHLSALMRYMLYEKEGRSVSLARETEYIRSFVALQLMRFDNSVRVSTSFVLNGAGDQQIESMLLIPFVENAFKHSTANGHAAVINVELEVDGDAVVFKVRNTYQPNRGTERDEDSGIGLSNVRRRLNLLYGDRYELLETLQGGWYGANLKLCLS